ncbi:hypothetical protein [Promicromonospora kroppenstedtii]|uniref:hypothetical protein n=1 Tax=Promicromonospora kroppenstedtii TaxID=440482 RepID=UPI0004B2BF8E|nr:hypothetical protein [Promicromonospora kroppenstedtii]
MTVWTTHRDHGTAHWDEVEVGDRISLSTSGAERTEIVGTIVALSADTATLRPWVEVRKSDFDVDRIYRPQ